MIMRGLKEVNSMCTRALIGGGVLLACASLFGAVEPKQASLSTLPNVIIFIMDDLGYGDIGSYGAPDVRTPNIDRLAREGVRLTYFYANGANCSPTRTALITGQYQQRFAIEAPLPPGTDFGLRPSNTSLPRLLRQRGYATALIGKWHLGQEPAFHPNKHGFDEFWGFLGPAVDYYSHDWTPGSAGGTSERNRTHHDLYHNDRLITTSGYLTDEITAKAKAFIEAHRDRPFFIDVSYNATHWPFQPPDLPEEKRPREDVVRDGTRAEYVAMLERADRGVGEILDLLDGLQLAGNTLVIFTSDNGGEWLSRNAPLFHRKSTLWEGGIRVPALLRWPGQLPAGTVSKQVGITMDLTVSILAAAGVSTPTSYRPDGINLLPLLQNGRTIERTLFWRIKSEGRDQKAVRKGRWKYLRDGVGVFDGLHEFIFDLEEDVGERQDLAAAKTGLVVEMRKLLQQWEADVGPPKPTR
jgi:arylsulfatase A-like enzyme